jgi:hypothetical protein
VVAPDGFVHEPDKVGSIYQSPLTI